MEIKDLLFETNNEFEIPTLLLEKQAVGNPNWNKYGYRFSEKQAYVLAKTAIDNELTQKN